MLGVQHSAATAAAEAEAETAKAAAAAKCFTMVCKKWAPPASLALRP